MKIQYAKFINQYDPVAVGWRHNGKDILIEFPIVIVALYAENLNQVLIELYEENKLNFYNLDGTLKLSSDLPKIEGYQFRCINKNVKSKTGISFLFNPISDSVGNEWRDIEQYELDLNGLNFLGKKIGIYR